MDHGRFLDADVEVAGGAAVRDGLDALIDGDCADDGVQVPLGDDCRGGGGIVQVELIDLMIGEIDG